MKNFRSAGMISIVLLISVSVFGQSNDYGLTSKTISPEELSNWSVWGQGKVEKLGTQIAMQESDDSQGVTIVSPKPYSSDIIIRYQTLALTSATVLVAMISVSDFGESEILTIPDDYDGGMGLFASEKENYFFAFKNAPHSNNTPFVRKFPNTSGNLGSATESNMIAGIYYDIEVGKYKGKLWLAVNGKKLFEVEDKDPLQKGHVALRIRGTAGFRAGCLIKDLVILSN